MSVTSCPALSTQSAFSGEIKATQSLRVSATLLITYVATVLLPCPVTSRDTSIDSAFLNESQPVVTFAVLVVPTTPADRELDELLENSLNADVLATEPQAVPVPKFVGCDSDQMYCDCLLTTSL